MIARDNTQGGQDRPDNGNGSDFHSPQGEDKDEFCPIQKEDEERRYQQTTDRGWKDYFVGKLPSRYPVNHGSILEFSWHCIYEWLRQPYYVKDGCPCVDDDQSVERIEKSECRVEDKERDTDDYCGQDAQDQWHEKELELGSAVSGDSVCRWEPNEHCKQSAYRGKREALPGRRLSDECSKGILIVREDRVMWQPVDRSRMLK